MDSKKATLRARSSDLIHLQKARFRTIRGLDAFQKYGNTP